MDFESAMQTFAEAWMAANRGGRILIPTENQPKIQDSNGSEDDNSFENLKLLWHGEIEEKLDKANPLLCTMIYDSCRYFTSTFVCLISFI